MCKENDRGRDREPDHGNGDGNGNDNPIDDGVAGVLRSWIRDERERNNADADRPLGGEVIPRVPIVLAMDVAIDVVDVDDIDVDDVADIDIDDIDDAMDVDGVPSRAPCFEERPLPNRNASAQQEALRARFHRIVVPMVIRKRLLLLLLLLLLVMALLLPKMESSSTASRSRFGSKKKTNTSSGKE